MDERTDASPGLEVGTHTPGPVGQLVGYARVSSADQNLDRQIGSLRDAGVYRIFEEKISGASRDRPELDNALLYLREGDTLVVTSMDRLARSVPDLYSIVEELNARGVAVKFLKEGQLYTADSNATSQLMLGIIGTVAQFERALIRERQAEGIARAKQRGAYKRAAAMTPEAIANARELIELGVPRSEVARRLGVGRTTLYKYVPTAKDEERPAP